MKTIITTTVAFFICTITFAQIKKADRLFDKWEYAQAAKLYQEAANKNPSADVFYRLGQCDQKMFLFQDAVEAYDKVNSYGTYNHADFYLNYGLVLKANKRYLEARDAFMKYDNMAPVDPRGKFYASSCDVVLDDLRKNMPVTVTDLTTVNTSDAAFSPALYNDGIVFAANVPASKGTKTFAWNGKSYGDLFYAERQSSDTTFGNTNPFSAINGDYNDGPATFSKNADTMYFSRVSRHLKGEKKRTLGVERSKIFYATMIDGKWSKEKPFKFNNDTFGVFTPFISQDGSRLYFASDMPGGNGQTDIYYCLKQGSGWSNPINAGTAVNTFGREQFPSLDSEGNLYYSSDGYKGYGGLDICVSRLVNGIFQKGEVLKAPINSSDNDYSIVFIKSAKSGYISSTRSQGKGDVDIYYFDLDRDSISCDINTTTYVMGFECKPVKKEEVAEMHHDSIVHVPVVDRGFGNMQLLPVYFDFDKSYITPEAKNNLDSIVSMLKAHPDWDLKISGFADSRGSAEYNLALSQRRAASIMNYFISKGIDRSRLSSQGFGETQLQNRCSDGVLCSEAEHHVNRRVNFTLVLQSKQVSLQ